MQNNQSDKIVYNTSGYDIAAIIFCIATLIIALMIGQSHHIGNMSVETDFYGAYVKEVHNILEGRPYTYQHNPPGYMLLVAAVSFLTTDFFNAAKLISAFAVALFGGAIYMLFKSIFDSRIALSTAILSMISLLPHSFIASTDLLGALLTIIPLLFFFLTPRISAKTCIAAGITAGIAYWVRYNTVFVFIGILFSLICINTGNVTFRERLRMAVLFIVAWTVTISPWLVINWKTNGSPFAGTAILQIASHFYHPAGDLFTMERGFPFDSLFDVIWHDPILVLKTYIMDILYLNPKQLIRSGLRYPAYLFAGAGLLLLLTELSKRKFALLAIYLFGYLLLGLVGFYFRYYLFIVPILFLFVTFFVFHRHITTALGRLPFFNRSVSWVIVAMIAVLICKSSYHQIQKIIHSDPTYIFELADVIRERSSPDDKIFAFKPHYGYYAGLESSFPMSHKPEDYNSENAEDYISKAREIGAKFIIYSDKEGSLWPSLESLADPGDVRKDLDLIYSHKPTNTLVYELIERPE
ncbi:MAG: hypothetical protein C4522_08015 [Desulfobacteraceae bacterium]|nr:MAG: hypothetical protein C4522_08015 [Desulfobacteraceae bacterium]